MVTQIHYIKENSHGKTFVIMDTGMHHLIHPPLYGRFYSITPIMKDEREDFVVDVVEPICDSTDFLAKNYTMEKVNQDELLAITDVGAYGIVLGSHYNSRSLPVRRGGYW